VVLAIDSDAHSTAHLAYLPYGIGQAQRGWLTPEGDRAGHGTITPRHRPSLWLLRSSGLGPAALLKCPDAGSPLPAP
jgi:hypothetical protein